MSKLTPEERKDIIDSQIRNRIILLIEKNESEKKYTEVTALREIAISNLYLALVKLMS